MSLIALSGFILLPAFAFGVWYVMAYNPGAQKHWKILPTLTEYRAKYPQCVAEERTSCCHCGSDQQLDLGLLGYTDWRRQVICRGCKNRLWRETDQ